jgi:hypothetical protein
LIRPVSAQRLTCEVGPTRIEVGVPDLLAAIDARDRDWGTKSWNIDYWRPIRSNLQAEGESHVASCVTLRPVLADLLESGRGIVLDPVDHARLDHLVASSVSWRRSSRAGRSAGASRVFTRNGGQYEPGVGPAGCGSDCVLEIVAGGTCATSVK